MQRSHRHRRHRPDPPLAEVQVAEEEGVLDLGSEVEQIRQPVLFLTKLTISPNAFRPAFFAVSTSVNSWTT